MSEQLLFSGIYNYESKIHTIYIIMGVSIHFTAYSTYDELAFVEV